MNHLSSKLVKGIIISLLLIGFTFTAEARKHKRKYYKRHTHTSYSKNHKHRKNLKGRLLKNVEPTDGVKRGVLQKS